MSDRYTKIVLTVIAAALVGLLAQNAIRPLSAQSGVQRVAICEMEKPGRCANVFSFDRPGNTYYGLPVLVQK